MFWQIIQVIQMVWSMIGQLKQWLAAKRKADTEERLQKTEEALNKAKQAKTPEEAFNAQEDIVSNKL